MRLNFKKEFTVVVYSSLFIFFSTLLLIKISPEFFIIFCLLPLFIIGLSTDIKTTLISYLISLVLMVAFFSNSGDFTESDSLKYLYINLILIFFFALFLTFFLKIKNFSLSLGLIISYYNLGICIFLSIFLIFYYFDSNINSNLEEIKRIYFDQIKISNPELKAQINILINFIYKILPALNSVFFLILTILNFFLSQKLLKKLHLNIRNETSLDYLEIPNWYFYFQLMAIFIFLFSSGNTNIFSLNILLVFSSLFIINGFLSVLSFLKEKKVNVIVKFLLLFLLFIFFSYLLIVFLFILGINRKIKQISNDFKIRGKK
jgi:hypothetical protein